MCVRTGRRDGLFWTLLLSCSHILRPERSESHSHTHAHTHTYAHTHTHTHTHTHAHAHAHTHTHACTHTHTHRPSNSHGSTMRLTVSGLISWSHGLASKSHGFPSAISNSICLHLPCSSFRSTGIMVPGSPVLGIYSVKG